MTTTTTTTTPAEQAADLAALQAAATEGEKAPAAQADAQAEQGPDLTKEITGLVLAFVGVLGPMFPSLKAIYTQQTTETAAAAVAGVCDKHGWFQGGVMGKWGPEIACAAVVGPLALATWQGIKSDLAARAPAKPADRIGGPDLSAALPAETPGQKTVTFGAPAAEVAA